MDTPDHTISPEEKTLLAHQILNTTYGIQEIYSRRDPMHELISTMLSHRTNHANEEKAYYTMLEKFGSWEGVRDAPLDELIEAIATSNFPEVKAPRIKKVVQLIIEEHGEANIDFLHNMPVEEAMQWLMSLPGVGLKTATLLLLFNFYKPVLPVDTHVHRVSQRVGMTGSKVSADKAHAILLAMLPKDAKELFNFHKHFFWHGQRVCTWSNPKCQVCSIRHICNWYHFNGRKEAISDKKRKQES
jgi:endonuclease-3